MTKARNLADNALTTVSPTELGYVDGVTSPIQTQLDAKATLPSQTGNSGKYLTTNGSATSWGSVASSQLQEVVFTSSNATWTIPTGVTGVWALVVGGGAGGGASSTASASNAGGGGGAGQVIEKYFAISGDTTLNITVAAGGAGGTAGGKGSSGSASSIVGNTSSTTYLTAAGGGGGGGGAVANVSGIAGASGGGNGIQNANQAGGGGGMAFSASDVINGILYQLPGNIGQGAAATTIGVTGNAGGNSGSNFYGGAGLNIWGRQLGGGGNGWSGNSQGISQNYGAGANTLAPSAGSSATANTGAGGNGGKTGATTALAGGAGGSGLVVLRYVG